MSRIDLTDKDMTFRFNRSEDGKFHMVIKHHGMEESAEMRRYGKASVILTESGGVFILEGYLPMRGGKIAHATSRLFK